MRLEHEAVARFEGVKIAKGRLAPQPSNSRVSGLFSGFQMDFEWSSLHNMTRSILVTSQKQCVIHQKLNHGIVEAAGTEVEADSATIERPNRPQHEQHLELQNNTRKPTLLTGVSQIYM